MRVRQFRYSLDNLGYVLYGGLSAMAVDGGAVDEIVAFIRARGLELRFIANTHSHPDHTSGNRGLIAQTGAALIDNRTLLSERLIRLDGEAIDIYHTPGHTADSLCFRADNFIITGDTLFNGTVGNCFSGDVEGFYRSIKTLMSLPDDTIVYAGHDYVEASMTFARYLEPGNKEIDAFMRRYDPSHVFSTLREERRINPYFKFNDPDMITFLKKKGLPVATELERWQSLMRIE